MKHNFDKRWRQRKSISVRRVIPVTNMSKSIAKLNTWMRLHWVLNWSMFSDIIIFWVFGTAQGSLNYWCILESHRICEASKNQHTMQHIVPLKPGSTMQLMFSHEGFEPYVWVIGILKLISVFKCFAKLRWVVTVMPKFSLLTFWNSWFPPHINNYSMWPHFSQWNPLASGRTTTVHIGWATNPWINLRAW